MDNENLKKNQKEHEDAPIKPDPETLGKTDPQEDMEGPVSSLMQKGSKVMESKEDKKDASKKHDEKM
ncbi:hypothetical protein [Niabella ginsengisoli]|uniref:Uncharacterized protein n=1 Tax=Niabella ginsengisoli TaxID=522298 RepID=A0ABS9SEZ2_9BACT|nr:hypothetical protein [Niabella ginsengisoli]MCH5596923.1 hypothetical protein [Niabella ginsengisoli]